MSSLTCAPIRHMDICQADTEKPIWGSRERWTTALWNNTQSLLVLSSWTGSCEEAFDGILTGIWKDAWRGGKGPRSPRSSNEKTIFFFQNGDEWQHPVKVNWAGKSPGVLRCRLIYSHVLFNFLILDPVHCSNTRNKLNISASGWRETAGI